VLITFTSVFSRFCLWWVKVIFVPITAVLDQIHLNVSSFLCRSAVNLKENKDLYFHRYVYYIHCETLNER